MTRQILLGYKQLNSSHPEIFPSLNAVYRMRHIGVTNAKGEKLKWHKIGGRYFLDQSELNEWLAGTEFAPGTKLIHGDTKMTVSSEQPPLSESYDADHPNRQKVKVALMCEALIGIVCYAPESLKKRFRFIAENISAEELADIARLAYPHIMNVTK